MQLKSFKKILIALFILLTMGYFSAPIALAPEAPKYTFYFVSHIGPADPNYYWLKTAIEDIEKIYPVKVIYVSPEVFSVEKQVELLEKAIAAKPDGLIVPITSPEALDEPLRRAIAMGIPVVASNIPDPRPKEERIPYLVYVGGDEYLTGYLVNKRSFELLGAESVKKTATFVIEPGHIGHELRAQGHAEAAKEYGIPYEKVAAAPEPERAIEIIRSYLLAHPEVNHVFVTAGRAVWWVKRAVEDLGKVPGKDVYISAVDESPFVLEPIREGWVVASHSQQFYLQGYLPVIFLYLYKEYGYIPDLTDVITGPVVIDKTNVEHWRKIVISVFGEELYNKLAKP